MNVVGPSALEVSLPVTGLSNETVDELFSTFKSFSKLALAVSGGPDSLGLLVLFDEWRQRRCWNGGLEVLCVDHGLRPESTAEAQFVLRFCLERHIPCHILTWEGAKPKSNLQDSARQARYRLFADHMEKSGAQALILAHHKDDQAETFLDRLTRGSGVVGLQGMSFDDKSGPEGLRLCRPFLSVRKKDLEDSLKSRCISWCVDPTNSGTKYKRSRLRLALKQLEPEGLSVERLVQTADHMRRANEAFDQILDVHYRDHVVEHKAGPLRIEFDAYESLPEELQLRLLCRIISRVTGQVVRPRFQKLIRLNETLREVESARAALGGAAFLREESTIYSWREPGRTPPQIISNPSGSGCWDFRFSFQTNAQLVCLEGSTLYLGAKKAAPVPSKNLQWPDGWPREAFDCAPIVWRGDGSFFSPFLATAKSIPKYDIEELITLHRMGVPNGICSEIDEES